MQLLLTRITKFLKFSPVTYFNFKKCYCKDLLANYQTNLNVNNVSLNKYISKLEEEYNLLKEKTTSKRLSELQPVISILKERKTIVQNLINLSDMLSEKDTELRNLAEIEKKEFEDQLKIADEHLLQSLLICNQESSCDSIVLEVSAGVGGQEAMLFAKELFDMYNNFIQYKGWECQLAEYSTNDMGGLRHASLLVKGDFVFQFFKYEAGVHRVQRIPTTEKSGRIHTSTVSVVALPQPSDVEIKLGNKDLKIETKRASGAGGQHVNTTDSAVRIVHLPTKTSVECQVNRSQIKNKEIALQRLKAILYQQKMDAQIEETEATRKSQVRSNYRNEKIRTYNFSQDRITDHRVHGNIHNLKNFLLGRDPLENLINTLDNNAKIERLLQNVLSYDGK